MKTPYDEHKESPLWETIDKAISELVNNHDLQELTPRDYIVGYLVKSISDYRGQQ